MHDHMLSNQMSHANGEQTQNSSTNNRQECSSRCRVPGTLKSFFFAVAFPVEDQVQLNLIT